MVSNRGEETSQWNMQCGPPSYKLVINPMNIIVIDIIHHSEIGVFRNQLSSHKSAINPMTSQVSYSFPMVVPLNGGPTLLAIFTVHSQLNTRPRLARSLLPSDKGHRQILGEAARSRPKSRSCSWAWKIGDFHWAHWNFWENLWEAMLESFFFR